MRGRERRNEEERERVRCNEIKSLEVGRRVRTLSRERKKKRIKAERKNRREEKVKHRWRQ
jgi:hypothetical protein